MAAMPCPLQFRFLARFGLAVFVVLWCGARHATADESDTPTLRVAVNGAPPYRIIEHEGNSTLFSGFYVAIIREAARRADVSLQFVEVPFKRALRMMEFGRADLMLGPNRTPERGRYMEYLRVPLPREAKVFYLRPGLRALDNYDALKGMQIGVLPGALYFPRFDADETLRRVLIPSYSSGLEMAMRGHVDAVIMPELLGRYLTQLKRIDLKTASYRIPGRPSYIAMSRKSPALHVKDRLVDALEAMVADGTMARLNDRFR
jgi:polar amino acid transport system substrate-binding protein